MAHNMAKKARRAAAGAQRSLCRSDHLGQKQRRTYGRTTKRLCRSRVPRTKAMATGQWAQAVSAAHRTCGCPAQAEHPEAWASHTVSDGARQADQRHQETGSPARYSGSVHVHDGSGAIQKPEPRTTSKPWTDRTEKRRQRSPAPIPCLVLHRCAILDMHTDDANDDAHDASDTSDNKHKKDTKDNKYNRANNDNN